MRRFSIRNLMGLVLAIAVAFAALRGANGYWAGGLLLIVLALFGYSILAIIHRQGRIQAAWLGFLVIGGGYLLAVRTLPVQDAKWLPTSRVLDYVEEQVIGSIAITVNFTPAGTLTTTTTSVIQSTSPPVAPSPNSATSGDLLVFTHPNNATSNVRLWNTQVPTGRPWAPFLPGAANGEAFKSVGHSLFALLAGWIGAVVSTRMSARRSKPHEIKDSPVASTSPTML